MKYWQILINQTVLSHTAAVIGIEEVKVLGRLLFYQVSQGSLGKLLGILLKGKLYFKSFLCNGLKQIS